MVDFIKNIFLIILIFSHVFSFVWTYFSEKKKIDDKISLVTNEIIKDKLDATNIIDYNNSKKILNDSKDHILLEILIIFLIPVLIYLIILVFYRNEFMGTYDIFVLGGINIVIYSFILLKNQININKNESIIKINNILMKPYNEKFDFLKEAIEILFSVNKISFIVNVFNICFISLVVCCYLWDYIF